MLLGRNCEGKMRRMDAVEAVAAEGVEDLDKFCVASFTSVSDEQHK